MSTSTEIDHHVLSDAIPLSIRFVRVSSVPFLVLIQAQEMTNVRARIFSHVLLHL